mmetsp:Transcript_119110/g.273163  ORF Transcript_119110/g.273163 Transcript_119110/m.273163 type:complete len:203 (-) Transcript_119110:139-747(-)
MLIIAAVVVRMLLVISSGGFLVSPRGLGFRFRTLHSPRNCRKLLRRSNTGRDRPCILAFRFRCAPSCCLRGRSQIHGFRRFGELRLNSFLFSSIFHCHLHTSRRFRGIKKTQNQLSRCVGIGPGQHIVGIAIQGVPRNGTNCVDNSLDVAVLALLGHGRKVPYSHPRGGVTDFIPARQKNCQIHQKRWVGSGQQLSRSLCSI